MSHGWIKTQNLYHPRINMDILENPMEWLRAYQLGFQSHYQETGEFDWDRYVFPVNHLAPRGPGVELATSRLLVVTSSGAYLKNSQQPFNNLNHQEDYSVRLLPANAAFEEISYSCTDLEIGGVHDDPQRILPLQHLRSLVAQGTLGALLPMMVSHCNYQPHAIRVVKELVPAVLKTANELGAHAALMLPTGELCTQTAGLVARALEVNGIASVVVSNHSEIIRMIAPPRALITDFPDGMVMGEAHDTAGQQHVLRSALTLLEQDAPLAPVTYRSALSID